MSFGEMEAIAATELPFQKLSSDINGLISFKRCLPVEVKTHLIEIVSAFSFVV
jgi:hypothetical protein